MVPTRPSWLKRRNRAFYVTIRDVDCKMINLSGGDRLFSDLVPVRDVKVTLARSYFGEVVPEFWVLDGPSLSVLTDEETWAVRVPCVKDYEVLVISVREEDFCAHR